MTVRSGSPYGRIKDAAWMAYRASAKTSFAKIGLRRPQASHRRASEAGDEVNHWDTRLYIKLLRQE